MKTFLYIFCQCTWGFLQSFLGFIVLLFNLNAKHVTYKGAVVTHWNKSSSVSLGIFMFLGSNPKDCYYKPLLAHEYGHTIQSLILGPLYLLVIGLPSFMWAALPYFRKKRKENKVSYYSLYTEKWANILGEKATGIKISNL